MLTRQTGKKAALVATAVLLSFGLMEFGAVLAYRIRHGDPFPRSEVLARLTSPYLVEVDLRAEGTDPEYVTNKILHPYLGFVYDPGRTNANSFGFFGSETWMKRSAETLNIAIFGGSVALAFTGEGLPALAEELAGATGGKRVRVACFAVDGFKQPQHLIALSFLLSLGAEYDVAINLDGFNEIALPLGENLPARIFPYYPRAWNLYAAGGFQPEVALATAKALENRSSRVFWRRLVSRWPWRHSSFVLVLWNGLDRRMQTQAFELDAELRSLLTAGESVKATLGPFRPDMSEQEVVRGSVRVWRDSSLQMAALCRANGIRYFHFLQPNQYVAGSKTFTEEERRIAFGQGAYQSAARAYPLLLEEGRQLRRQGVLFFDLTAVFEEETDTIYIDNCCHVNLRGNQILARAIGREIRTELEKGLDGAPSSR